MILALRYANFSDSLRYMYASFSLRCASSSVHFLSNTVLRPLPPHAFPSLESPLPCKLPCPSSLHTLSQVGRAIWRVLCSGSSGGVLLGEASLCRRPAIHFTAHRSQLLVAARHAWLVECGVLCFAVVCQVSFCLGVLLHVLSPNNPVLHHHTTGWAAASLVYVLHGCIFIFLAIYFLFV